MGENNISPEKEGRKDDEFVTIFTSLLKSVKREFSLLSHTTRHDATFCSLLAKKIRLVCKKLVLAEFANSRLDKNLRSLNFFLRVFGVMLQDLEHVE